VSGIAADRGVGKSNSVNATKFDENVLACGSVMDRELRAPMSNTRAEAQDVRAREEDLNSEVVNDFRVAQDLESGWNAR